MSEYSYDDRPRRRHHTREYDRPREPEYVQETTYIERGGKGAPVRDLVYRPRDDSIEDIPRDFPPPSAEYRQTKVRESFEPRRARSVNHRDYDYEDDYYSAPRHRGSRRSYDRDGYYSDEYERPRPRRRKSIIDQAKDFAEGAGLGGVVGALTGRSRSRSRHRRGYDSDRYDKHSDRDRYDRRSRRYSSSSRSRSRSGGRHKSEKKWEQAAKAAIVAGAVEAFRSRKQPGAWTGEKGQRIATAALGAAGIDSLVDKDPDNHGKRHVAESAIGGLLANRLANGSRSRSRGGDRDGSLSPPRSRSRSRSILNRARSLSRGRGKSAGGGGGGNAIRDVAGAGAVLAAGKALYDRVRSKSRSRRDRSRSRSVSSEDSYVPSRRRRGQSTDDYRSQPPANAERSLATTTASTNNKGKGKGSYDSSDSESTTDMENKRKKMRAPVAQPYPATYADANPYGAVPPPPIGAPPGARY